MDEFIDGLVERLALRVGVKGNEGKIELLKEIVINAVDDVRSRRRYPVGYSEAMILSDLENYKSNIRNLSIYDYNQIGAEGQIAHSELGTVRQWRNREDGFRGIISFVR